ncbi:MAG: outer membrane lipoprotein carrier protein [bacterium]|jgi:outer membrane lipoprotein carrier protein
MKNIFILAMSMMALNPAVAAETSLTNIEGYLNSITTLEADFQQYAPGTPFTSGTFYLNRPKKFLWQYKLPHQQKLVSTGSRLFFHDPKTEQTTQLPLHSGFAAILTKNPISLSGDDFIVHDIKTEEGVTVVEMSLTHDEENRFVLRFKENPMRLLSMSSKDNFGQGVSVLFANHKQGHKLNENLFKFKPALEAF